MYPPPRFYRSPIDYALLGFFVLTGVSAFLSYEPMVSIGKLRAASLFTIVYLFAENIPSGRRVRLLALTLVASSMINVAYTAAERVIGRGVKVEALRTESPLSVAGVRDGDTLLEVDGQKLGRPEDLVTALSKPDQHPALLKVYRHELVPTFKVPRGKLLGGVTPLEQLGLERWSRGRDWRASGFYGHFTTYAEVLQLIASLTLGLLIKVPLKRSWSSALLLAALGGLGLALVLTVTRASWASFLFSTAVILLVGTTRRTLLIVSACAIPIVLAGLFLLHQKRNVGFFDQKDQSITWRETVWREGFHLLVSKPRHLLVGVGMDSIKGHWRQWDLFDQGRIPMGHMHSDMLEIALERGVPALVIWLVLLFIYARMLWRLAREKLVDDWIERGIVLGALGGLAGFFTSGLVHYNWGDSEVVTIFYLIMGLCLFVQREVERKGAVGGGSSSKPEVL